VLPGPLVEAYFTGGSRTSPKMRSPIVFRATLCVTNVDGLASRLKTSLRPAPLQPATASIHFEVGVGEVSARRHNAHPVAEREIRVLDPVCGSDCRACLVSAMLGSRRNSYGTYWYARLRLKGRGD